MVWCRFHRRLVHRAFWNLMNTRANEILIDGKWVKRWRCPHHPEKFVCPARQHRGRRTGCTSCISARTRSPAARTRRADKWDGGDIRCIHHPERKCNRSTYVIDGRRYCSSCHNHRADGTKTPVFRKHCKAYRNRRRYQEIAANYAKGTSLKNGLQMFERLTGMKIGL